MPLTTRCWGGFAVKILFISQLAVKSQIMLKYSHYPESPQLCFPGLWHSLPLSGQGKILIRSLMKNSLLPPQLPSQTFQLASKSLTMDLGRQAWGGGGGWGSVLGARLQDLSKQTGVTATPQEAKEVLSPGSPAPLGVRIWGPEESKVS